MISRPTAIETAHYKLTGSPGAPTFPRGWIAVLLYVVISPVFYAYMQSGLNSVWRAEPSQTPEAAVPLYGLRLLCLGVTKKQHLGRVCVVWLAPGVERILRYEKPAELPQAPDFLEGVIRYEGTMDELAQDEFVHRNYLAI